MVWCSCQQAQCSNSFLIWTERRSYLKSILLQFQSVEYVSFHTDSNRASKKNHKILILQIDVGWKVIQFWQKILSWMLNFSDSTKNQGFLLYLRSYKIRLYTKKMCQKCICHYSDSSFLQRKVPSIVSLK